MPDNPKDLVGAKKAPLFLVPPALVIETAPAMANGAAKYGPYNWRDYPVKMSVYIEAALRHLLALMDGEDNAPDSGIRHDAHAAACLAIIMDARGSGTLIDDRAKPGPASMLLGAQDKSSVPMLTIDGQDSSPAIEWYGPAMPRDVSRD
jgi:hypothetical protein